MAETTTTPHTTIPFTPCLRTMDSTAVSSIEASLTQWACWNRWSDALVPEDACPAYTNSAAVGPVLWGGMGLVAGVAAWSVAWMVVGGLLFAAL
jgi:hypothetical protein